jgi:hypothetical protein
VQRIYFCSGSTFDTGDAIATAVLDYALALGELRRFDTVDLPMRRLDGGDGRAHLLLSPMSQISMESVETDLPEVLDADLVSRLVEAADRLRDPLVMALPHDVDEEQFFSGV